jgi:4-aminobutyrate aminotransferase-like enzyme
MVNSGSEANDLALRIARAARPGATHVAVMGAAYHGHTGQVRHMISGKTVLSLTSQKPASNRPEEMCPMSVQQLRQAPGSLRL